MKHLVLSTFLMGFYLTSTLAEPSYNGSTFNEVWSAVNSDPYQTLPQNRISCLSLLGFFRSKIGMASDRTLSDRSDLLPPFKKLAHPNGIVLKGVWQIDPDIAARYGGYFKPGSQGLILARASVAFSKTKKGSIRAFGLAGKLFPTMDENERVKTGNFFAINDLGGTKDDHFTDATLTNAPPTTFTIAVLKNLFYALTLAFTFRRADSDPSIRQLYEISELGESDPNSITTPRVLRIMAASGHTVDQDDFRDELSFSNRTSPLTFNLIVEEKLGKDLLTTKIGTMTFTESVASYSGDHRLHFHHPRTKKLKHLE